MLKSVAMANLEDILYPQLDLRLGERHIQLSQLWWRRKLQVLRGEIFPFQKVIAANIFMKNALRRTKSKKYLLVQGFLCVLCTDAWLSDFL